MIESSKEYDFRVNVEFLPKCMKLPSFYDAITMSICAELNTTRHGLVELFYTQ